jgi:non-heme chloroperoxidase
MAALELDDGSLWYEERGAGTPLVFLHGAWMSGDAWEHQLDHFAEEYRVVSLDSRGHGRTGGTDPRRYSIELFADDLEALLAHLEVDRPILCGLSMGNMVIQEYLSRHPDGPAAAVLGGPVRSLPPVALPQSLKALTSPAPGLATSLSLGGTEATFRSMLRSIRTVTGEPWIAADPAVRSRAIEAAGELSRSEFRKVFQALYRYDPPDLSDVLAPTLAVYGRGETSLVKRQGQQLADSVARGAVQPIPGAAHLVNLDRPAAFNATVEAFLDETGAAA